MPTFLKYFCVVTLLALAGTAQKPPKVTNPVLRASFVYCSPGDSACEAANRVRQDVNAEYVHGESSVTVQFQLGSGSRDLTIGLPTTSRSVFLDFRDQVHVGEIVPAFLPASPVQLVKAYINVLGAYYAKENCPAEQNQCDHQAKLNMGGWKAAGDPLTTYAALWNPDASASRPVNQPEVTSYVNVRYIRDDGLGKEMFIITPKPTGSQGNFLSSLEATGRKSIKNAGQYNMPFTLIARPK